MASSSWRKVLKLGLTSAASLGIANAQTVSTTAGEQIDSVIETALILTDKDAVSLGALQFDPGRFVELESESMGSSESLSRRRQVSTFVLPWHWQTDNVDKGLSMYLRSRLMYLQAKQEVIYSADDSSSEDQGDSADTSQSRVYGGYFGGGSNYKWNEEWQGKVGAGIHLVRYQNDYKYSSPFSQTLATDVDGLLFNSSVTALIGELRASLSYHNKFRDWPWSASSTYTFYAGDAINSNRAADAASPRTFSWINGIQVSSDMPPLYEFSNRLRFFTKRVDVGGEVQRTLATDHYYQLGVGWLFDLSQHSSWVDNLGASMSLNVGSALSGGSVSILYNEKW